jgi:magnesium transporter
MAISDIMKPDPMSINHLDDKEAAADMVQKYELLSLPVVDNAEKLIGLVAWDDAVEVLEEKLTDEYFTSSGVSSEEFETGELLSGNLVTSIKSRTPWLMFTLLGSFVTVWIGNFYTDTIHALPVLAVFIPLLGGMGGNVGTQSSALIVRGLATGHVSLNNALSYIVQQSLIGVLIGLLVGLLVSSIVAVTMGNPWLGIIIGGSLLVNMTVAAAIGTLIPLTFKRYNIDPAIASSPFISTAIDITGLTIYFSLAATTLHFLLAA